jgi:glutamine phosphoribosylpyrophosphate amidotransferase
VGADSLRYLSVDGLLRAVRGSRSDHCVACFTGRYPDAVQTAVDALATPAMEQVG